jgi:PKD repeat protein
MNKIFVCAVVFTLAAFALIVIPASAASTPVAAFIANATTGSAPLGVQFIDQSTNTPTSWLWSFGDGGTSTIQDPLYVYTSAGTYVVTLTATNTAGSNTVTKAGYITVTKTTPAPVANLVSNITNGTLPLAVQFIDSSTNSPYSWAWSFGDGGVSTDQNPLHTYTSAGTYTVTLTATNTGGSDTITRTAYITVSNSVSIPSAAFKATVQSGTSPLTVQFIDTSTNSPTSWLWSFGDGGTSTVQSPSHTYTSAGSYTVTLTATNTAGSNTVSNSGYITVAASLPVTSFTANVTSGTAPFYVQFMDNSTNSPYAWAWSFGDGGTSTLQDPVYEYTDAGIYTVEFTATNSVGSNTTTQSGFINATSLSAPVPSFTSDVTSGPSPLPVRFTDTSSPTPRSWDWSFGDGSTSSLQNPSHTYIGMGRYTVELTVTNSGGSRTTTATGYITVTSEATTTPVTEVVTPYATVSVAPTSIAVTPVTTTANVSAPSSSSGNSFGSLTVIGIIVALVICGAAFLFLRRPPRGSHGHRRQDI